MSISSVRQPNPSTNPRNSTAAAAALASCVIGAVGYIAGNSLYREMARKEGILVIGMRSREHWVQVHPSFATTPFLVNKQSPWLTRRNMDEQIYDRVLDALRS